MLVVLDVCGATPVSTAAPESHVSKGENPGCGVRVQSRLALLDAAEQKRLVALRYAQMASRENELRS